MSSARAAVAEQDAGTEVGWEYKGYKLIRTARSPNWYREHYDAQAEQTRRHSLRTSDLEEAKELLVAHVMVHPAGDTQSPTVVKLHDVMNWYWEHHQKNLPSAGTYKTAVNYWFTHYPSSTTLADLTPLSFKGFVDRLRKADLAEGYIIRILTAGRSAMHMYRDMNLVTMTPKVPNLQTRLQIENTPSKGRPLSIEEIARLFVSDPAPHVRHFMTIMLNTGARPSAAQELTKSQVDFSAGLVDLNPPGRAQTIKRRPLIPLTSSLRASLPRIEEYEVAAAKRRRDINFKLERYVIFRGKPRSRPPARAWRDLVERAGFPADGRIVPYSLRHSLGRWHTKQKTDREELEIWLGHRPTGRSLTTAIYAPYDPDYLKDVTFKTELFVEQVREEIIKQGGDPYPL